jgi:Uma2 family endonuclease
VMVSEHVPAKRWKNSSIDIRGNGCRVDVLYSPDQAFVDIELVVVYEGAPHSSSVMEVNGQLHEYLIRAVNRELRAVGEDITFINASGRRVGRMPDSGLCPKRSRLQVPETPRLIIEVSVEHVSLTTAQENYQEYFDIPTVRAVLLIKFFGYGQNRTAAAVAVLYRRDDQGNVVVDDVVSFGTASIYHTVIPVMARIDRTRRANPNEAYRDLSGGPNGDLNAPAEITIPATDLYFGTNLVGPNGALLQPRPDLVIDLRELFQQFIQRF